MLNGDDLYLFSRMADSTKLEKTKAFKNDVISILYWQ